MATHASQAKYMAERAANRERPDPREARRRACLRCDRPFMSEGPYNRLCEACRWFINASPTPETVHLFSHPPRMGRGA